MTQNVVDMIVNYYWVIMQYYYGIYIYTHNIYVDTSRTKCLYIMFDGPVMDDEIKYHE